MKYYNRVQKFGTYISKKKGDFSELYGAGFICNDEEKADFLNVTWQDYLISFILEGDAIFKDDETYQEHNVSSGFFFQGIPHKKNSLTINDKQKWREFFIIIPLNLFNLLSDFYNFDPQKPVGKIRITRDLVESFYKYIGTIRKAKVNYQISIVVETISLLNKCFENKQEQKKRSKKANKFDELMNQSLNLLNNNLAQYIDLEKFSSENGVSYTTFRTKFKKYFGLSPYKYRIKQRMIVAADNLVNTDKSIKDISNSLGYSSPFEFSNYFKKEYGVSPLKYRQRNYQK